MVDVRYWHKADIEVAPDQCPLSGVKRTIAFPHAKLSAFDPKRTYHSLQRGHTRRFL